MAATRLGLERYPYDVDLEKAINLENPKLAVSDHDMVVHPSTDPDDIRIATFNMAIQMSPGNSGYNQPEAETPGEYQLRLSKVVAGLRTAVDKYTNLVFCLQEIPDNAYFQQFADLLNKELPNYKLIRGSNGKCMLMPKQYDCIVVPDTIIDAQMKIPSGVNWPGSHLKAAGRIQAVLVKPPGKRFQPIANVHFPYAHVEDPHSKNITLVAQLATHGFHVAGDTNSQLNESKFDPETKTMRQAIHGTGRDLVSRNLTAYPPWHKPILTPDLKTVTEPVPLLKSINSHARNIAWERGQSKMVEQAVDVIAYSSVTPSMELQKIWREQEFILLASKIYSIDPMHSGNYRIYFEPNEKISLLRLAVGYFYQGIPDNQNWFDVTREELTRINLARQQFASQGGITIFPGEAPIPTPSMAPEHTMPETKVASSTSSYPLFNDPTPSPDAPTPTPSMASEHTMPETKVASSTSSYPLFNDPTPSPDAPTPSIVSDIPGASYRATTVGQSSTQPAPAKEIKEVPLVWNDQLINNIKYHGLIAAINKFETKLPYDNPKAVAIRTAVQDFFKKYEANTDADKPYSILYDLLEKECRDGKIGDALRMNDPASPPISFDEVMEVARLWLKDKIPAESSLVDTINVAKTPTTSTIFTSLGSSPAPSPVVDSPSEPVETKQRQSRNKFGIPTGERIPFAELCHVIQTEINHLKEHTGAEQKAKGQKIESLYLSVIQRPGINYDELKKACQPGGELFKALEAQTGIWGTLKTSHALNMVNAKIKELDNPSKPPSKGFRSSSSY